MNKKLKKMKDEVLSSPEHILVRYVRGRRGERVGVLVGVKHVDEHHFRIGWSKCNTKADKFDPKLGLEMAVGRAFASEYVDEEDPIIVPFDDDFRNGLVAADLPPSMNDATCTFVGRCVAYFKKNH